MKKFLSLLISTILIVACCGCSSEKSNSNLKISKGAQKAASSVIQYIDNFIDFDIGAREASEKINDISKDFVSTGENDSKIETEISLCYYYVNDFVDGGYQGDNLDKSRATNRLITERNSLASDSGNALRELSPNNINNYSLAELCINRNLIKYSFVTTTIPTKELLEAEKSYSCHFTLKDKKHLFLNIYTCGFNSDIKDNDYITVTGVFDYVKSDSSVSLMIYAVNNTFVADKVNKKLFEKVEKYTSEELLYDIIE